MYKISFNVLSILPYKIVTKWQFCFSDGLHRSLLNKSKVYYAVWKPHNTRLLVTITSSLLIVLALFCGGGGSS